MNTRVYLVIAAVLFYLYWVRQSAATVTALSAAGTPNGTMPVSTVATSPQAPVAGTDPITAIVNTLANAGSSSPTVLTTFRGGTIWGGDPPRASPILGPMLQD